MLDALSANQKATREIEVHRGDYEDQRDRLNPYRRPFDQATTLAPTSRYPSRTARLLTQRGAIMRV